MRIVLCFAFSLLILACTQQKTAQEYLDAGKNAVIEKELAVARLAFKNAISENASFHAARFELGYTYYLTGDFESAEFYFESAYQNGYEATKVVPLLASTYLNQNDIAALQELLSIQKNGDSSQAFRVQLALYNILLLARTERLELAEESYSELKNVEGAAAQNCALCLLTKAHLESYRSPTDAIKSLDQLIALHPDYSSAYLLRGQLYFALRNTKQALVDFKFHESLQPENVYIQFLIAVTAVQLKEKPTANSYVEKLLVANPQQPFINHLQALLAFEREDYVLASDSATRAIMNGLRSPPNYMIAGVSAYQQGNLEIAYRYLNKAKLYYPDNSQLRRLLTLIEFKFGNLSAAGQGFLRTDVQGVKDALFGNLIAYQLLKDEQFDAAQGVIAFVQDKSLYQPVVNLQSKVLSNQINHKNSLMTPDISGASSALDSAQDSKLIRIILLIETQAIEQAKTESQEWLAIEPENIDAINILAHIYQLLSDTANANALFEQALVLEPTNIPSLFFKAKLAMQEGEFQTARQLYKQVLRANPQNLAALQGALQLTFSAQQSPNWNQLLEPLSAVALTDDHVVAIADAMFKWQEYAALNRYLFEYQAQDQWSELIWMIWLKNSFSADAGQNFLENFSVYLKQYGKLGHILFALSILESQKEYELLISAIQLIPERQRSADAVRLQHALALAELQQFEKAFEIINETEEIKENQSARWYISGLKKVHEGDHTQAASYFSAYYQTEPSFHSLNSLVAALTETKRADEATTLTKAYLKENPSDVQARLSLALKLASTQPAVALELLESNSVTWFLLRNWKLSYNIAWLYISQNRLNKALVYSENALLLNPENDQVKALHARVLSRVERE